VSNLNTSSSFYLDPTSDVAQSGIPTLASQPVATWFGNWNTDIKNDANALVTKAQSQGAMPVMVAYNIPERDCGSFSAGGANNPAGYESWIQQFAQGIGSAPATVILEPDALAQITCLSSKDQSTRLELLADAVRTLKANANTKVYIDAGHANWIDPTVMAGRLAAADINAADGFSLNVSNFDETSNETMYGTQVSTTLSNFIGQNKHFVIDTGRNGNGSDGTWCNPSGRAIGLAPTTNTGNSLIDAYLWIKTPGESDGTCNGGPTAGTWWPYYALSLIQNTH
jgi:endoglucanase